MYVTGSTSGSTRFVSVLAWAVPATGVLVEMLLDRGPSVTWPKPRPRSSGLAAAPTHDGFPARDICCGRGLCWRGPAATTLSTGVGGLLSRDGEIARIRLAYRNGGGDVEKPGTGRAESADQGGRAADGSGVGGAGPAGVGDGCRVPLLRLAAQKALLKAEALAETGGSEGAAARIAVATKRHPVPGCRVQPSGVMRYLPVAYKAYIKRYLADGFTAHAVAGAPSLAWNRNDALQDMLVCKVFRRDIARPQHFVPTSEGFGTAVRGG